MQNSSPIRGQYFNHLKLLAFMESHLMPIGAVVGASGSFSVGLMGAEGFVAGLTLHTISNFLCIAGLSKLKLKWYLLLQVFYCSITALGVYTRLDGFLEMALININVTCAIIGVYGFFVNTEINKATNLLAKIVFLLSVTGSVIFNVASIEYLFACYFCWFTGSLLTIYYSKATKKEALSKSNYIFLASDVFGFFARLVKF